MHICEPWLAVTDNFVPKKNVALGAHPKRTITQARSLSTPGIHQNPLPPVPAAPLAREAHQSAVLLQIALAA